MTKREIIDALLTLGVTHIQVIQVPDYCGGYDPVIKFQWPGDPEYGYCEDDIPLDSCEYIEFSGDTSDAVSHLSEKFCGHYGAAHETPFDYYMTMRELIENKLARMSK